jgi:hypothetical protein
MGLPDVLPIDLRGGRPVDWKRGAACNREGPGDGRLSGPLDMADVDGRLFVVGSCAVCVYELAMHETAAVEPITRDGSPLVTLRLLSIINCCDAVRQAADRASAAVWHRSDRPDRPDRPDGLVVPCACARVRWLYRPHSGYRGADARGDTRSPVCFKSPLWQTVSHLRWTRAEDDCMGWSSWAPSQASPCRTVPNANKRRGRHWARSTFRRKPIRRDCW